MQGFWRLSVGHGGRDQVEFEEREIPCRSLLWGVVHREPSNLLFYLSS